MDLRAYADANTLLITAYSPSSVAVAGTVHTSPILLLPNQVIPWPVTSFDVLTADDFQPLFEEAPGTLIIGTGPTFQLLPHALKLALKAKGIIADSMDTRAACRTYNVLASEGRDVAAALLIG